VAGLKPPVHCLWILTVSDDSAFRFRITIYKIVNLETFKTGWFERLTEGFPFIKFHIKERINYLINISVLLSVVWQKKKK